MPSKGLLIVLVDPAPTLEEELNDWYDTEHLPERAALPGFETASRYTSLGDGPRYAALYDLSDLKALETEAYLAVSGDNFSPWTRRVTSRSHPFRMTAQQVRPGDTVTGVSSRLMILKIAPATAEDVRCVASGLDESFAGDSGLLQHRIFSGVEPTQDFVLAIAEFAGSRIPPLLSDAFGDCRSRIVMAATYRPYRG